MKKRYLSFIGALFCIVSSWRYEIMKKNIGNALALYPTPLVVVGAMVNGKPNWLLVGYLGIIGHDQ